MLPLTTDAQLKNSGEVRRNCPEMQEDTDLQSTRSSRREPQRLSKDGASEALLKSCHASQAGGSYPAAGFKVHPQEHSPEPL